MDHEGFGYTRIIRQVYNEMALIGSNTRNIFFACLFLTIYLGTPLRQLDLALEYGKMCGFDVYAIKDSITISFQARYFLRKRHPWLYKNVFS